MRLKFLRPLALVLALYYALPVAFGGVVIEIIERNGNVTVQGSGTLDTTILSSASDWTTGNGLNPSSGYLEVGSFDTAWLLNGVSGPSSFGSGLYQSDPDRSGDRFGVVAEIAGLVVPVDYVSGSELLGWANYAGETLGSLGITPGTYVWTWGSGANADTFTINASAVPEPSSYAALLGLAGLGFASVRRRQRQLSTDSRTELA